jgi:uncharacterized protein (TIGR03032 family)
VYHRSPKRQRGQNLIGTPMTETADDTTRADDKRRADEKREVRYEHTREFLRILAEQRISLLVSTYQAGKLVVLGTQDDRLTLSFHNFEQAMGIAIHRQRIAVGSRSQVWFLRNTPSVAGRVGSPGSHDACYLTRASHITEDIHGHEMAWCGEELWLVNTRFSCLCTLDADHSFVPRWRPPFISALAPEDRCHLNGLAVHQGRPQYVTAHSETDTPVGWRPLKVSSGCVVEVPSGRTVARGFAMPHSPRLYGGRLWLLNSGCGQLVTVRPSDGHVQVVSRQPGYTRGLSFAGPYAFIGLSKIRETATFGGVPIAEDRESLKCGVGVVDLRIGRLVAHFEFHSGVEEIFDVQVLDTARNPYLSGPFTHVEGRVPIWVVPLPGENASEGSAASARASSGAVEQPAGRVPQVPVSALAHYQRGNSWFERDGFAEAAACFEESLRICPEFADAYCNMGVTRQFQGRFMDSVASLQRALEIRPDMPAAHFNLAMTWFLMGELDRGWSEYEWRWKCRNFGNRPAAASQLAPAWKGESLNGKSLLVYGEQGVGDEIMFASCVSGLLQSAGRLILACEVRLTPLFARSFPDATVVPLESLAHPDERQKLGQVDWQTAAGSLPRLLGLHETPSAACPGYLLADADARQTWRGRLQELGSGRKIGISWRGGKDAAEQRHRSIALEQWKPILTTPECRFVKLQHGESQAEVLDVASRCGVAIAHWPEINPIVDLDSFAALISALDLVISVDNSTLHLAAALGVPTWGLVAFPSASYWRWFGDGEQSPWYGSLRLQRKRAADNWEELLGHVAATLAVTCRL